MRWTWVAVGVLLFCGACKGKHSEPPATPQSVDSPHNDVPSQRIFTYVDVDPESIDPNLVAEGAGTRIASQLFEPLLIIAPDNGTPKPGHATHWEVHENGRRYTFHLRKNARWSDGKKLTSADFLYSWERALNPKTKSRNAEQYWVIQGAKAYNKGDSTDFSTVGVKALDEYRLSIVLASPVPYFLDLMTYVIFSPVPRHAIEKFGNRWTRPEHFVGNGAFKLTEFKHRDRVAMKKNDSYWGASEVWLDQVIGYMTESEKNAFDWYERGKVMWTPGVVPAEKVKELKKSNRPDYRIDPILCIYYYVINTEKPPLNNPLVRRAINMAIDKGRIARQVLGQGQKPALHLVPPMFSELRQFHSPLGASFDPAQARQLLKEAGYGPGLKPLPDVTVVYNTMEGHRLIAEFVQRSLRTNLNINVKINNMEWRSLLPKLQKGDFEIGRSGWCADFPDPQDFLQVFHSSSENNYSQYKNPKYDDVIDKLRLTSNQKRRNELSYQAESIINAEVPVLPLYFYTRGQMLRTYVRGMNPQIQGRYLFKRIQFKARGKGQ